MSVAHSYRLLQTPDERDVLADDGGLEILLIMCVLEQLKYLLWKMQLYCKMCRRFDFLRLKQGWVTLNSCSFGNKNQKGRRGRCPCLLWHLLVSWSNSDDVRNPRWPFLMSSSYFCLVVPLCEHPILSLPNSRLDLSMLNAKKSHNLAIRCHKQFVKLNISCGRPCLPCLSNNKVITR